MKQKHMKWPAVVLSLGIFISVLVVMGFSQVNAVGSGDNASYIMNSLGKGNVLDLTGYTGNQNTGFGIELVGSGARVTGGYTPVGGGSYTPVGGSSYTPVGGSSYTPIGGSSYTPVSGSSYTPIGGSSYTPVSSGYTYTTVGSNGNISYGVTKLSSYNNGYTTIGGASNPFSRPTNNGYSYVPYNSNMSYSAVNYNPYSYTNKNYSVYTGNNSSYTPYNYNPYAYTSSVSSYTASSNTVYTPLDRFGNMIGSNTSGASAILYSQNPAEFGGGCVT